MLCGTTPESPSCSKSWRPSTGSIRWSTCLIGNWPERPETCDNVVLSGTTAADYSRTLLSLSQTMQAARGRIAVVQMFDKRWRLARRVEGLLNKRRSS